MTLRRKSAFRMYYNVSAISCDVKILIYIQCKTYIQFCQSKIYINERIFLTDGKTSSVTSRSRNIPKKFALSVVWNTWNRDNNSLVLVEKVVLTWSWCLVPRLGRKHIFKDFLLLCESRHMINTSIILPEKSSCRRNKLKKKQIPLSK